MCRNAGGTSVGGTSTQLTEVAMRSFARAPRDIRGVRSRLRLALSLAIAMAVSLTAPALAAGAADITRFDVTFPVDAVDPADCFDGTAHVTGSERVVGQRVDLGDNNFRLHGTLTDAIS